MKVKKGDLIIVLILVVALVSWFVVNKLGESEDDRKIVIEVDGELYKAIPISPGMERQQIHIDLHNGKYIDIVADETGAYVSDVVCPDKVCQKTGLVSRVGQSIVCLPNKVVVYIEGETQSEVDDVSY